MKKILRFSSIGVFVLCSLFFSYSVSAVDKTIPNEAVKGLEIGVFNTKIISQEGNKFKISFDVTNNSEPQAGLKYTLKLIEETKDKGQFLVDSYSSSEVFSIGSKNTVSKEVEYVAPNVSGTYKLFVFLNNESGYNLGLGFAGEVKLSSGSSLYIAPSTCYLTASGDKVIKDYQAKYNLTQGVDIAKTEDLKLSCEVQNYSKTAISVTPQYETHLRTMNGEVVETTGGDNNSINFNAGEKKKISVTLPKANKPQAYDVKVLLKNGENLSNPVIVHYVIQGVSATILRASLDKDYYKKGDVANIFVSWAPSADIFANSRVVSTDENKNLVLVSSITGKSGGKCLKSVENNLSEISTSHNANISKNVRIDCKNPKLLLQIKDESGNILDQKEFSFNSSTSPENGSSNKFVLFIIIGVLIVAGLAVYFINLKKKNNEKITQVETNNQ